MTIAKLKKNNFFLIFYNKCLAQARIWNTVTEGVILNKISLKMLSAKQFRYSIPESTGGAMAPCPPPIDSRPGLAMVKLSSITINSC